MAKFIDLTGQRIGKLLIIKKVNNPIHIKDKRNSYWLCECDCGNKKIIIGTSLRYKRTISCGCYNKEYSKKRRSLPKGIASMNSKYGDYKRSAKKRNLSFSLTKEYFLKLTQENCFYCGENPSNINKNEFGNGDFLYNGLDRIDMNKGYELNNVLPCCWKCNRAKGNMNIDQFYEWIDKVSKHIKQTKMETI